MKVKYIDKYYEVEIKEEDGYFVASIPELGSGAFLGTGKTRGEALKDLKKIKEYFEKIARERRTKKWKSVTLTKKH